MKIWLTDVDELVTVNNLKEITSPVLFQRGSVPHPDGLISNEIFGITTKDRKSTFAYIDLHGHYFAPHVYKLLKALFSGIDGIVSGTDRYVINDGVLVKDNKNGETGLEWLYTNWKKIDWNKKSDGTMSMRQERIDLLMNTPVKELFITKQIVIPAFYRDITTSSGGGGETSDINNLYTRIIRQVALTQNSSMFDFTIDSTIYAIQNDIVSIYDYFKSKIEKKQGLIRKYLMG